MKPITFNENKELEKLSKKTKDYPYLQGAINDQITKENSKKTYHPRPEVKRTLNKLGFDPEKYYKQ